MDGFRWPGGTRSVVCSLLILGSKYQVLPCRRFWAEETHENRNTWMMNG
jgi:hypothetical protein